MIRCFLLSCGCKHHMIFEIFDYHHLTNFRTVSVMSPTVSKLDPVEKVKEEGDAFFKAANFEKAAVSYTKCLSAISDKVRNCEIVSLHCPLFSSDKQRT